MVPCDNTIHKSHRNHIAIAHPNPDGADMEL